MQELLHNLLLTSAATNPHKTAVVHRQSEINYEELAESSTRFAEGLCELGLQKQDRVAVYLPKRIEGVAAIFGTTLSGGVFVPINPLLKSEQVVHILMDCNVRVLVTSADRLRQLQDKLIGCVDLCNVVVLDSDRTGDPVPGRIAVNTWESVVAANKKSGFHRVIDHDMASIFYTSGSTGKPKGVVLSHRNMVAGAQCVAEYLESDRDDRLLAVLPFSFDYGFSQLSIAFSTSATVVLMDYLFAKDVIKALTEHKISALAGVPPLWVQLAKLEWPDSAIDGLRYITNSGGAMPQATLSLLRRHAPNTKVFLMYGLTEAFRSTYLDPEQLDIRPESIGKAIPNNEIMLVNDQGEHCKPNEIGEIVHRGPLVSLGYWNDVERTNLRFRPVPGQDPAIVIPELAVWSGDTATIDEEGYLYFVGRRDDMIKTSGYRVSPNEVEEAVYESGLAAEAIAIGVPHPEIGQAIILVAVTQRGREPDAKALMTILGRQLPNYMVPAQIVWRDSLPRNPNGKIDRKSIQIELAEFFMADKT